MNNEPGTIIETFQAVADALLAAGTPAKYVAEVQKCIERLKYEEKERRYEAMGDDL